MNDSFSNKTFDEIEVGDSVSLTRTLSRKDIQLFAIATGDMNPVHLDEAYSKSDTFHQIIGHGMWTGSLFSTLLGMQLPGPGMAYRSQTLQFLHPVNLGDTITASVVVKGKDEPTKCITFETTCTNQAGMRMLQGEACVVAPTKKITWKARPLPEVQLKSPSHDHAVWLFEKGQNLAPLKTAVIHPVDALSIQGAIEAAKAGMIDPILIGPSKKLKIAADEAGIDITPYRIVPTEHSHEAAAIGVSMVKSGEVEAIMKGKLSTEELMEAIINKQTGIRTERRMSHVFVLDVPSYPKPLLLTDAALNITPSLSDKKDIVQNAIDLFTALGLGTPKVAILSAVETVNEKIPSTLDASALSKMSDRGQITGGIVDGPLAFDNAISRKSSEIKGIESKVAGEADILVVPDLVSGNILYKELSYFSGAHGAGIVLGAQVPIILTSRASDLESRIVSCALALMYARSGRANHFRNESL